MGSQGRTKAALSRSNLTPRQEVGQHGSSPGLALAPQLGLGFPHLYSEGWTSLSEREDPSLRLSCSPFPKAGQQIPWIPLGIFPGVLAREFIKGTPRRGWQGLGSTRTLSGPGRTLTLTLNCQPKGRGSRSQLLGLGPSGR